MIREYKKSIFKRYMVVFLFFVLLMVFFYFYLISGDVNSFIVFEIRLPQALGALFTGASLGLAGLIMQEVLKNDLASPFTLGISQGALFGVSISIVFFNADFLELFAFIGGMSVIVVIFLLSREYSPEVLVLVGVAISSLFGAGSMFVEYFADDVELSNIINWSFGDLSKSSMENVYVIGAVFISAFLFFWIIRWSFSSLMFGRLLGINIEVLIFLSLLIATLLSSISVAYFGIIGFVGLIAPHLSRLIIGGDFRFLLLLSVIMGALLLLVADFISKLIIPPIVIPIGIITAFIGAPMFLILLLKRKNGSKGF